jgi:hypothetical protein
VHRKRKYDNIWFKELITALRTGVDNEGTLDKEATSYDDIFDSYRFQTNVTVFAVDNVFSLTVKSKGDREENTKATYSNIESTAISYASIFETLWIELPSPS